MCLMVKDEAPYLEEWLAFHSLCGASHFRIYDNGSTDGTLAMLARLAPHYDIEVVPWTEAGITRQQSAFNHASRALAGRYGWVAFLDADEFLFDPRFRPLPSVLAQMPAGVGAVAVNQRVFGSSGQIAISDELVIRRFTRRAPLIYPEHEWIKSIIRPECVDTFHLSHSAKLTAGTYVLADGQPFRPASNHPGHADRIAEDGLVLHHYILKSLGEFQRKQQRGAVSDRTGYKRLTDDYFTQRDRSINAAHDPVLLRMADLVQARMRFAHDASQPADAPEIAPTPLNQNIRLADLPGHHGFHSPDSAQLSWVKQGDPASIAINTDAPIARLRLVTYLAVPSYPLARMRLAVNGVAVAFDMKRLADNWCTVETVPVALRPGANRISLTMPSFIPVKLINPRALDPRNIAIAVTEVAVLTAPAEAG